MEDDFLNIKNILNILFKVTKKNANILADRYLLKEVSIISKWKNKKADIKSEDINRIVDFAVKESSEIQRKLIRKEIITIINYSSLTDEFKEMIIGIMDFRKFIEESLNISTSWAYNLPQIKNTDGNKDKGASNRDSKSKSMLEDMDEDTQGAYKGVIRFDLQLLKNKKGIQGDNNGTKQNIILKNSEINLTSKNKAGKLKKYIGGRAILSIVILIVVLSYTLIQGGNTNKDLSVAKDTVQVQEKNIDPKIQSQEKLQNMPVKQEQVVASKESVEKDEDKTDEKYEPLVEKPQQSDNFGDRVIKKTETKTDVVQKNNDVNVIINGSSDIKVGLGNNIIINDNSNTVNNTNSEPEKEPSAASEASRTTESSK